MKQKVAQVIVPRPLPGALSYLIPETLADQIQIGSYVEVPFRKSTMGGFVVGFTSSDDPALKDFELKPVESVPFSSPAFTEKDLGFFKWVSDYYQLPMGEVFHSAFPKPVFKVMKRATKDGLEQNPLTVKTSSIVPNEEQAAALKRIDAALDSGKFKSFLIYGVTGSGKTEIYLQAAKQAIARGKSALILVPEIALTPQLRTRFEERFGDEVAVMHSGLSEKERREYWWAIQSGKRKLVVGARSALFAPVKDIGLIVVDEEHEPSYKQEDRLRYNARDLALVRARQHGAVAILGSATPSIETYYAATTGKHELIEIKKRANSSPLPETILIDLKKEPRRENSRSKRSRDAGMIFSPRLRDEIAETVQRGEQVILFVNRKGFSNFILCKVCAKVPECLNCSVSLTYHMKTGTLKCHYCAFEIPVIKSCQECGSDDIDYVGVGTELVEKELQDILPRTRIARLDAETADNVKKLEKILDDFRSGTTQVLVGTQMIAKGHDFPNVTLIGIILADTNLHLPDFRSSERTFQLLTQVAGRAGRGDKPGRVVIQTYMPEHYVITSAMNQDYKGFYEAEIGLRKDFGYPPFTKLAQIEFRHLKESFARGDAEKSARLLDHLLGSVKKEVEYLGPAPASIARIANQFRWRILLKSEKSTSLNAVIKTLRAHGARFIDVDPVTTL